MQHSSILKNINNIKLSTDILINKYFNRQYYKEILINSDKNFLNDIQLLDIDYKNTVPFQGILNHIRAIPSERRFNILNKLFNFKNFEDKHKAEIILVCLLSGKGKIFQKCLKMLSDNILKSMPEHINKYLQYTTINQNLSNNIQILKNNTTEEQFTHFTSLFIPELVKSNINSFSTLLTTELLNDKNTETLLLKIKTVINSSYNDQARHLININSIGFSNLYIKNIYDDNEFFVKTLLGSKKDITPFLKNISNKNIHIYNGTLSLKNYYEQYIEKNIDYIFKNMVANFFKSSSIENRYSFYKYFQVISLVKEELYFDIMNKTDKFMNKNNLIFVEKEKQAILKNYFVKSLNSRINNPNIKIAYEDSKSYEDFMKEYQIKKEKSLLQEQIKTTKKAHNNIILKRI